MKKLVILFIAVLITIMLSTTLYFQSNKSKEIKVEDQSKNEVIIPQEKIIETSSVIQEIENTEQEKIVNEIQETKDIPKVEETTEELNSEKSYRPQDVMIDFINHDIQREKRFGFF